jgi:hypothetical protein
MKPRSWAAVLVVFFVSVWMPLAYGVPPDPGSISGLWDESDHDDVVELAGSLAATSSVHADDAGPPASVVAWLLRHDPGTRLSVRLSATPPRAPPTD